MKGTETFLKVIKDYLDKRAQEDESFANYYSNSSKSIEKCCDFIINEVKKSGRLGFCDDEIFGMAIHYYNEEDIKDEKAPTCSVVVNLSDQTKEALEKKAEEEFKQAKLNELKRKEASEKERLRKKNDAKKNKVEQCGQLSLFDF